VGNARLDQYDVADINDDPDLEALDPETRALAEAQMARRDRRNAKGDGKGGTTTKPIYERSRKKKKQVNPY
jgi:hypothetical protein